VSRPQLLATLVASGKDIAMFCDFHGHSRRKNVFMFGCDNEFGAPERVFPKLLSNRCSLFSFRNCSFKVQKAKYNCARVAVWRDLGIVNSFTIEASFAGPDDGEHANTHFSPSHYEVRSQSVFLSEPRKSQGVFRRFFAVFLRISATTFVDHCWTCWIGPLRSKQCSMSCKRCIQPSSKPVLPGSVY
jgi:hypothetical protein